MLNETYYISITGLRLKGPWHALKFWWHAMPSFAQAQKAEGNILTEARKIDGVHHTLTVWTSETAMKRFLYRGSHRKAIKTFPNIATGSTCGDLSSQIPSWDEAAAYWTAHGRDYSDPDSRS